MIYTTWYEFKKDLEKRLGYSLLNWRWLEVRPRSPLPWGDSQMQSILMAQVKGEKRRKSRRRRMTIN